MNVKHLGISLVLLVSVILISGCSDDDSPVTPPAATIPGFASADLVVAAYLQAYQDMDDQIIRSVLRDDFQMMLQLGTTQEFPRVGSTLDRTEELQIAARMFSGLPLTSPDGYLIQPISSIQFPLFEQQGTWTAVEAGQDFEGSNRALFDVTILADRPGASTLKVEGQLILYVAATDTTIGGTDHTFWQMVGQKDLTGFAKPGIETEAWGTVKALYWNNE